MTLEGICSRAIDFIAAQSPESTDFDRMARELFAFQFENNPAYRAFCIARRVNPENLASIGQIPAIVTTAFKDFELSAIPKDDRTTVFHSSGTTEQRPSRHFHSKETLQVYEKSLLQWFQPYLLRQKETANFLILAPHPKQAPNSSLAHMFGTVAEKFGDAVFYGATIGKDSSWSLRCSEILQECKRLANEGRPAIVCGTAFSFVHLCDYLARSNAFLKLPNGSRVFETGGYKGRSRTVPKPELHKLIAERTSIPLTHIVSEYGMSELSSQAYDRVAGHVDARIFHFPHWASVSIVSAENGEPVAEGETGLVRVLDLANVGSVSAIQAEDLAVRRGSGFELIGRTSASEPRGCSLMQTNS